MADPLGTPELLAKGVGAGFVYGGALGSIYHFGRGACWNGFDVKRGWHEVRTKGLGLAGRLAVFSGTFELTKRLMLGIRHKEDSLNDSVSWAVSVGVFNMRHGLRIASRRALAFGAPSALLGVSLVALEKDLDISSIPAGFHYPEVALNPPTTKPLSTPSMAYTLSTRIYNFTPLPTGGVDEQTGRRFGLPHIYLDEMARSSGLE